MPASEASSNGGEKSNEKKEPCGVGSNLDAELALFEAEVSEILREDEAKDKDNKQANSAMTNKAQAEKSFVVETVTASAAPTVNKEYMTSVLGIVPAAVIGGGRSGTIGPALPPSASAPLKASTSASAAANYQPPPTILDPKLARKRTRRGVGEQQWNDDTMLMWNENDYRLFVGDLGNEVTDEMLTKAFMSYPSFLRARVVRKKDSRSRCLKGTDLSVLEMV